MIPEKSPSACRFGPAAIADHCGVTGVIPAVRFFFFYTPSQLAPTRRTRLGVYDISAAIWEGGMGEVYRATDAKLKRQVTIKVLPPHSRPTPIVSRAFSANGSARRPGYPHIAAIYRLEGAAGMTLS